MRPFSTHEACRQPPHLLPPAPPRPAEGRPWAGLPRTRGLGGSLKTQLALLPHPWMQGYGHTPCGLDCHPNVTTKPTLEVSSPGTFLGSHPPQSPRAPAPSTDRERLPGSGSLPPTRLRALWWTTLTVAPNPGSSAGHSPAPPRPLPTFSRAPWLSLANEMCTK